ncbi:MAG: PLP-dependent aminotransferase family protein [Rhodopila sp.]|nr:PLP-dependent aminotransferase family protein [Rhodopila sp.]
MQFLQGRVQHARGPRYRAIADAIAQAIAQRIVIEGDQLPTQRDLAVRLDVDVTTVTRAYTEARHRGLLDGTVGRGTFVRAMDRSPASLGEQRSVVDMSMNLPPQPTEPALGHLLREGLNWLLSHADMRSLMNYRSGAGIGQDRAAAAGWLHPTMGDVNADRIVVCGGAQCAMTALLTTLARPGETVLTETLTYPAFRALAAQLGIRLVAAPTDDAGLVPDALAKACAEIRPKAIYCVPTIHNPTTVTMPVERRHAIADVILRQKVSFIEDDPYGLLPSRPLPAIASLAAGEAYYIGTVSKCLSPGLRTAFVVAPRPAQASRLVEAVRAISLTPSPLLTSLVTRWIEDGTALKLRNAVRQESAARQALAREQLAGQAIAAHPDGLHVWLTLPAQWSRLAFSAHMRRHGLALVPSDAFLVGGAAPNAVRICLGAAESRTVLRDALEMLADALRGEAPTYLGGII